MNTLQRLSRVVLCLALLALGTATTVPAQDALPAVQADDNFAVMPCRLGKARPDMSAERKEIIDCTLGELCYLEGSPLQGAAETITALVQQQVEKRVGARVTPLDRARERFRLLPQEPDQTLRAVAIELGKKLKVDYVVASTLWRFDERQGGTMTVQNPASVAFAVFLVDVESGQIAWQGIFDKTQTSLSENLLDAPLFIAKGMRWVTAQELASYGVERMFTKFPSGT